MSCRKPKAVPFRLAACVGVLICLALTGPVAAQSARDALKATGVERGLAVHLGSTDGAVELALTNGGKMLVHGLALSRVEGLALSQVEGLALPVRRSLGEGGSRVEGLALPVRRSLGEGGSRVEGLALDAASTRRARETIHSAGLYGLASVQQAADLKRLPYGDNLINLLVAERDSSDTVVKNTTYVVGSDVIGQYVTTTAGTQGSIFLADGRGSTRAK